MMLVNYIRKNGKPFGCVVALGNAENYTIGWSKCRKGDLFKKERAREIAVGRALTIGDYEYTNLPFDIADAIERMNNRAKKYFKVLP